LQRATNSSLDMGSEDPLKLRLSFLRFVSALMLLKKLCIPKEELCFSILEEGDE